MQSRNPGGRPRRQTPEGQSWCPSCKQFKSIEGFHKSKGRYTGCSVYCKPCQAQRALLIQHRSSADSRARRYGISEHVYWDLYEEQGHVCAICQQPETHTVKGTLKLLSVDHDHITGYVRGLLCVNCNTMIGQSRDDISILERAIEYLQRTK
jgi:hypothetical protein